MPMMEPQQTLHLKERIKVAESKLILKEVIVVEGKDDESAVKAALDAEVISTHGYGISAATIKLIEEAYNRCGIIIFTDPDYAGNNIRRKLSEKFPEAKHAYISREAGRKKNDIGVENASPETIRKALEAAHAEVKDAEERFTMEDLFNLGLAFGDEAARLRDRTGEILGIGYCNSKTLLKRLNNYGITKEELLSAIEAARANAEKK